MPVSCQPLQTTLLRTASTSSDDSSVTHASPTRNIFKVWGGKLAKSLTLKPPCAVQYTITRHKTSPLIFSYMAVETAIKRSTIDSLGNQHAEQSDVNNIKNLLKSLSEKNEVQFSGKLQFANLSSLLKHGHIQAPLDNHISDLRAFQINKERQSMSILVGNPGDPDYSIDIKLTKPAPKNKWV